MKNIVKNFTTNAIVLSILAILIGALLLAYPGISLEVLGIVVGAFLIVQGVTLIILDIKAWRLLIPFEGMLKGILSVVLGVILLVVPGFIATYIGVAIGVYMIVFSFGGIKLAAALRGTDAPWVLMIILNILTILLGCCVIWQPEISALSLTMTIGIALIVYSIINIVNMFLIKKDVKDVEKLIAEKKQLIADAVEAEPVKAEEPKAE